MEKWSGRGPARCKNCEGYYVADEMIASSRSKFLDAPDSPVGSYALVPTPTTTSAKNRLTVGRLSLLALGVLWSLCPRRSPLVATEGLYYGQVLSHPFLRVSIQSLCTRSLLVRLGASCTGGDLSGPAFVVGSWLLRGWQSRTYYYCQARGLGQGGSCLCHAFASDIKEVSLGKAGPHEHVILGCELARVCDCDLC